MLISHTKKFIFVHLYKNAGSSIGKALLPHAYPRSYQLLNPFLRRLGILRFDPIPCAGHASAKEIRDRVGPRYFDRYHVFAVVRNPWDWQLSMYNYMRIDRAHDQHELAVSFSSFDDYLDWRVTSDLHLQTEFLVDRQNQIIVDRIMRFERLRADFDDLCRFLGVKATLPHLNKSVESDYRQVYSARGRDLVAQYFAEDIERFGYTFENGMSESLEGLTPLQNMRDIKTS